MAKIDIAQKEAIITQSTIVGKTEAGDYKNVPGR